MILSFDKKEFSEKVLIVSRFAERKHASLPALSAILILASDDGIKLRATNLETAADLSLQGSCRQKGVAAVPSHVLAQVAASLAGDGEVALEHSGETVTIKSGSSTSTMKTVPYDDFPSVPFPENPKNRIVLPGSTIQTLFSTLASCASTSTVRPELASIFFSIEGGIITAVATDSFRLAEKKIPLASGGSQGKFLIPAKNALDIAQALPESDIIVSFDEHQCAFVGEYGMFVSRLTNATYPDYRQIFPKESVVEATMLKRDFEFALRRTAVFSDAFQKVRLGFEPKKGSVSFFARNNDIGESTEVVRARVSGSALDLSFNHRYLMAVLGLSGAESITLTSAGIGRPLIIRGVGDASLLYLVSPMNQ